MKSIILFSEKSRFVPTRTFLRVLFIDLANCNIPELFETYRTKYFHLAKEFDEKKASLDRADRKSRSLTTSAQAEILSKLTKVAESEEGEVGGILTRLLYYQEIFDNPHQPINRSMGESVLGEE